MKNIKSFILASILLTSVSTFAGYTSRSVSDTFMTKAVSTQAEAFQLGVNKLVQLKSTPQKKLENKLHVPANSYVSDSLRLNEGAFVTTQPRMSANGELRYIGIVNYGFSFTDIDD